jgi:hypothetical protein
MQCYFAVISASMDSNSSSLTQVNACAPATVGNRQAEEIARDVDRR